jgi:hypothetical protein
MVRSAASFTQQPPASRFPLPTTVRRALIVATVTTLAACSRGAYAPPVPNPAPFGADSATRALAKSLAPVLYLQRDEPFPLDRVVAVVHPTEPIVAYHLLWRHDVNGQWLPWAKPSDEEVAYVGYDPNTGAPTQVWTYWHGTLLHTLWLNRGTVEIDVQWGKHGSLPRGIDTKDLPPAKTLNSFYAYEILLLPDILVGKLVHGGPTGFFHSFRRYRDFSRAVPLAARLDLVVKTDDPRDALHAVFGRLYSNKRWWP